MSTPPRQRAVDTVQCCTHATDPDRRPHCRIVATIQFGASALCQPCADRRSTVGKGQPGTPLPPSPSIDLLDWIDAAHEQASDAERTLHAAVARGRQAGLSWAVIGARLGVTRQAAQQRFARAAKTRSTTPATGRLDPNPASNPSSPRRR
ncbi:MAG: hypothetical protein NVS3B26_22090 [Mycobacteriales bacterium]